MEHWRPLEDVVLCDLLCLSSLTSFFLHFLQITALMSHRVSVSGVRVGSSRHAPGS